MFYYEFENYCMIFNSSFTTSLIFILFVYFSSKAEILISSSQLGEILSDNLYQLII